MNSPFTDTRILSPPTQSACICVVSFCAPQPSATVLGERSKYIQSFSSFCFNVYIHPFERHHVHVAGQKMPEFHESISIASFVECEPFRDREWNHNLAIRNPLD